MVLQLRTVILISSSLLVVALVVRELASEARAVSIGRVRSIHPTPATVSPSTSTAVTFSLRATTAAVTSASAFVRFWRIYLEMSEEMRKIENKISDSSQ